MPKKATKKTVKKLTRKKVDTDIDFTSSKLNYADIFGKAVENAAKKGGSNDVTKFDAGLRSALVGVPFNNLALEVCFSESVLGLGRFLCLDGLSGTCKSSIMWHLCKVIDQSGGASCVIDTEHKATENLGQGIVGYDMWPKINFASPETFEEAMMVVTGMVNLLRKSPHGKTTPLLIGIDSIGGAPTAAEVKKIDKEGTAARGYAENALLAARYINYATSKISDYPIILVGVRHERIVEGQYGKTREAKGAGELGFAAFATFSLTKVTDHDLAGRAGRQLLIHLKKGTDPGTKVPVTMWWKEEITPEAESLRHIWFDWEQSAFDLLTTHENKYLAKRKIAGLKDVLGPMNANNKKVICKPLGLTVAAPPAELCKALYHPDNKKVLDMVRAVLSIRVGQEFKAGENFDKLKEKQRALILSRRSHEKTNEESSQEDYEENSEESGEENS